MLVDDLTETQIKNGGYGTGGPTSIPHVWIDSYAVYTNRPPSGAFREFLVKDRQMPRGILPYGFDERHVRAAWPIPPSGEADPL